MITSMTIEQFAQIRENVLNDGYAENVPISIVTKIVWLLRHCKCACNWLSVSDDKCAIIKVR